MHKVTCKMDGRTFLRSRDLQLLRGDFLIFLSIYFQECRVEKSLFIHCSLLFVWSHSALSPIRVWGLLGERNLKVKQFPSLSPIMHMPHQVAAMSIQIIVFIKRAVSNAGIAITGSGRPPHPPGLVTWPSVPGPELTAPIISCTGVAGT